LPLVTKKTKSTKRSTTNTPPLTPTAVPDPAPGAPRKDNPEAAQVLATPAGAGRSLGNKKSKKKNKVINGRIHLFALFYFWNNYLYF
jgi:hypothetical protein